MEAVGGNPPSLSFYRSLWSGDIVNMEHICHEFLKKVLEKAKKKKSFDSAIHFWHFILVCSCVCARRYGDIIRGSVLNRSKRQEATLIPQIGDWGYKRGRSHRVQHDTIREKNGQVCRAIMEQFLGYLENRGAEW